MNNKIIKEIISWILVVVAAYVMAFLVTHYVIIKAEVPSGSMKDTIQVDDRLIGWRLAYLFSEPERGDIVIFELPDNPAETYIKRVIGLPGEKIEIVDGKLYINDEYYEEPYIKEEMKGSFGPFHVPEDSYFMLGDNRNHSLDARFWDEKYVTKDKIYGKAWLRYAPDITILK